MVAPGSNFSGVSVKAAQWKSKNVKVGICCFAHQCVWSCSSVQWLNSIFEQQCFPSKIWFIFVLVFSKLIWI